MKNLLIFVAFVFVAFAVVNNFLPLASRFKQATERAKMPFRYAELYAREPETEINIPIRKIKLAEKIDKRHCQRVFGSFFCLQKTAKLFGFG